MSNRTLLAYPFPIGGGWSSEEVNSSKINVLEYKGKIMKCGCTIDMDVWKDEQTKSQSWRLEGLPANFMTKLQCL